MLDLEKKADVVQTEELKVSNCPICGGYVCHVYFMQDAKTKKKSKWFACSCGVVFNAQKPSKVYDEKYWLERSKYDKKLEAAYQYPVHIYAPIIEELIYGRRVLIIGRPNTYQEEAFLERGWVPTIIDKNTCFKTVDNVIAADFETYQFPKYKFIDNDGKETLRQTKYSLIWIYHTIDNFLDPVAALAKCQELLAEDGIIVLMGADTDFINTRSSSCFIHWKHDENGIMWNRRSLAKQLDQLGFNVILARQNYEHRFPIWDDYHIIAQKRFF